MTEPGSRLFLESTLFQRLAAALALDAGDCTTARDWLEAHDRWLDWSGAVLGRAEGLLLWRQLHLAEGDSETARQYALRALEQASTPRQPMALIAIHRILGQLDTDAKRYTDAEQQLQESLSLAGACAIPFERVLTLVALAELRTVQGRADDAHSLLAEIHGFCEPLDAKLTLDRVDALASKLASAKLAKPAYPAGLTAREVEILQLVAQGLTDSEVADCLYLSPRTVSSHLRSVYNKLGVGSRAAASRYAAENDLL